MAKWMGRKLQGFEEEMAQVEKDARAKAEAMHVPRVVPVFDLSLIPAHPKRLKARRKYWIDMSLVSDMTPAEFKEARHALGWPMWQMAIRLGLANGHARVSKMENGKEVIPVLIAEHIRTLLCLDPTNPRRLRWRLVRESATSDHGKEGMVKTGNPHPLKRPKAEKGEVEHEDSVIPKSWGLG